MTASSHRIDLVGDISCPFCAIAVTSLGKALDRVGADASFDLRIHPYQLNPQMPAEGQDFFDYLSVKSNSTRDQVKGRISGLTQRAADAGFTIALGDGSRIYNTFDAHCLLHWAGLEGQQQALDQALYSAYFTQGRDVSNHDTLVDIAASVGLDADAAREVLVSRAFAEDVQAAEQVWKSRGVNSVPAIFIDGELVHSGAQTAEVFEQTLRSYGT